MDDWQILRLRVRQRRLVPMFGAREMPMRCAVPAKADSTDCDGKQHHETRQGDHKASVPCYLCHQERGDIDEDLEQHPHRIGEEGQNATLFVLK